MNKLNFSWTDTYQTDINFLQRSDLEKSAYPADLINGRNHLRALFQDVRPINFESQDMGKYRMHAGNQQRGNHGIESE